MNENDMASLMLLMTKLKSKALKHLPVFFNKIPTELRSNVCVLYKNYLTVIYEDTQTRSWFADNIMRLEDCNCALAEYLNSNKNFWPCSQGLLQLSRVS